MSVRQMPQHAVLSMWPHKSPAQKQLNALSSHDNAVNWFALTPLTPQPTKAHVEAFIYNLRSF